MVVRFIYNSPLTILKYAVQWHLIFTVLHTYHHLFPEHFHHGKRNLCPHSATATHFPLPTAPGTHKSAFSLYGFSYSGYFIEIEWHNMCPFVSSFFFFFFLFWPHLRPAEIPGPGIEPVPKQWPELLRWQWWILNPLCHKRTSCLVSSVSIMFLRFTHVVPWSVVIIPFYGWIMYHCTDLSQFAYPFVSWWTFGSCE